MSERRVGVRGIAYQNGKLLSVLHKDKYGAPVDYWAIPGGGLDLNESLTDGLYREMIEETGIAPRIGDLLFVQQFSFLHHSGEMREQLEFFFHIKNPEDYRVVDLAATSHGTIELADCKYIDPRQENILPAFLRTVDLDAYTTTNQPVFIWNELVAKATA